MFSHAHSTLFWKLHHIFLTSLSETIQDKKNQFRGFLSCVTCISSRTDYTERTHEQPHPLEASLQCPLLPHPFTLEASLQKPLFLAAGPLCAGPSFLWTAKMLLVFSPPAANCLGERREEKGRAVWTWLRLLIADLQHHPGIFGPNTQALVLDELRTQRAQVPSGCSPAWRCSHLRPAPISLFPVRGRGATPCSPAGATHAPSPCSQEYVQYAMSCTSSFGTAGWTACGG